MPATFTKIQPTEDRLLVELYDWKAETEGEVHLTGENSKNMCIGFVDEVGPGLKRADGTVIPLKFKKGQQVLFDRTNHIGFDFDCGPNFMLIRESAIWALMGCEDDDSPDDEGDELD